MSRGGGRGDTSCGFGPRITAPAGGRRVAFKVGDRVEYTGRGSVVNEHRIGKTGEVTDVDPDGVGVSVKWDDGNALPLVVQEKNLRVVTAAPASDGLDVLAVIDAEIASLPIMAELAMAGGIACDATDAIVRLSKARAAVAELIEADQEYDAAREGYSDRTATPEQIDRLARAELRRRAALAKVASNGEQP